MLEGISRLPIGKREGAMRDAAKHEWKLCAEDPLYWLDAPRHIVPYAYTQDYKPTFTCNLCADGICYAGEKRFIHLLSRHGIDCPNIQSLKQYFLELDKIRPFPVYEYMVPIIECWQRHPLMAIEKSRDMMLTWLIVALYTWDTIFHKGVQNIFQSEDATKTRELVRRAWTIYYNQPKWLKSIAPATRAEGTNRAGRMDVLSLQSELIGFPQGEDKIRMYHPSGIFSDEAAFNPAASATFAAIKPAIAGGGRYTAISSANASWFMQLCQDRTSE